ncbi:MAG: TnpV protein [Dysosmobacter sp.]|nr:TnpV protein [Dysosmobacter sp.]
MKKSLFEQMGGTYHQEGDYFLPNLSVPKLPAIGIWGQRRRRYLKEHCQALYTALLLSGKLNNHLSEVDKQAEAMFSQLVKQMAEQEGITEQFKAENQMKWVGQMNSVRNQVEEIIYNQLIFA